MLIDNTQFYGYFAAILHIDDARRAFRCFACHATPLPRQLRYLRHVSPRCRYAAADAATLTACYFHVECHMLHDCHHFSYYVVCRHADGRADAIMPLIFRR